MKFGQLIESNVRNIFFEKSYTKLLPGPFLKSQNWAYQKFDMFFYYMSSNYIETKLQTTCFYLI